MNPNNAPIARFCRESPGTNPPAATGRHRAAYPIDVAGPIHVPRAEVLHAKKTRPGQRVCAAVANWYLGLRGVRRGLLAGIALGAWQSAAGQAPTTPAPRPETVVVQGLVLDDSLNVPVPGLFLYLNRTKYGAITDAQGKFTLRFPTAWKPVRGGMLSIQVAPPGFTFKPARVPLDWRTHDPAHLLTIRLASAPGRGRPNLHGFLLMAPPLPPPVYPASSRTARP